MLKCNANRTRLLSISPTDEHMVARDSHWPVPRNAVSNSSQMDMNAAYSGYLSCSIMDIDVLHVGCSASHRRIDAAKDRRRRFPRRMLIWGECQEYSLYGIPRSVALSRFRIEYSFSPRPASGEDRYDVA